MTRQRSSLGRFPAIEFMESRRLLAADIVLDGRDVLATGTDGNDTMRIERVGTDDVLITINGSLSRRFDMDDVDFYVLDGLGGADSITKVGNITGAVTPAVTLRGGEGTDTLQGRDALFVQGEIIKDPSGRQVLEVDFAEGIFIEGTSASDVINLSNVDGHAFLQINNSFSGLIAIDTQFRWNVIGRDGSDRFNVGTLFPRSLVLFGDAGNDFFDIERLNDVTIWAGGGNDTLFARGDADDVDQDGHLLYVGIFSGDSGIDTIQMDEQTRLDLLGYGNVENVTNAQGTVFGNGLDNRITVRASNTAGATLHGRDGDDTLVGGPGPDTLLGEEGDDTLFGNAGADTLDGGVGIDRLDGGTGSNTLLNGENDNLPRFFIANFGPGFRNLTAYGTFGNDTMNVVRTGLDDVRITVNGVSRTFDMDDFDQLVLYGGPGTDTISAGSGVANVFFFGRSGTDRLNGNDLRNVMNGGAGGDTIFGNGGEDRIEGAAGNDSLDGGGAADSISGGDGNDTITGGSGADELDGDTGDDTFFARDGTIDTVNGSGGFDRAQVDPNDTLDFIEQIIP